LINGEPRCHVPFILRIGGQAFDLRSSSPELSLLAETTTSADPTPPIAYEYIWFAGQPVAQIETATDTVHYYFNDHLGTPILQTSASGAVDWRVEYEPYGAVGTIRSGASQHQPLRFPGQEYETHAQIVLGIGTIGGA
jgi:hypothetical protein